MTPATSVITPSNARSYAYVAGFGDAVVVDATGPPPFNTASATCADTE